MALLALLFAHGELWIWKMIMASYLAPLVMDRTPFSLDVGGWGLMLANLAMVLAHPIKPNPATAIWTVVGLFFWFSTGLMFALQGV